MPITSGWKDGYYAAWWIGILSADFQTKSELASPNTNWESPAFAKAWNTLISLRDAGYMTPHDEGIALFPDAVNNFGAGKGAMFLGSVR